MRPQRNVKTDLLNCFPTYRSTSPPAKKSLNVTSVCACVFPITAKALRGLQRGHRPGVAQQVSPVRPGLRRVLPGAGPLLRLGRTDVLAVHPGVQKVPNSSPAELPVIRAKPALTYNKEDEDKYLTWHVSKRAQLRLLKHFISTVASDLSASGGTGPPSFLSNFQD